VLAEQLVAQAEILATHLTKMPQDSPEYRSLNRRRQQCKDEAALLGKRHYLPHIIAARYAR
jgi:hypothetical protein